MNGVAMKSTCQISVTTVPLPGPIETCVPPTARLASPRWYGAAHGIRASPESENRSGLWQECSLSLCKPLTLS